MGNPFYIQPADYGPALQGLNNIIKEKTIEQKYADIKQQAVNALKSGDPNKMLEFVAKNPEFKQAAMLTEQANHTSKRTLKNSYDASYEFLANPTEENLQKVVDARNKVLDEENVPPEQRLDTNGIMDKFKANPESVIKAIQFRTIAGDTDRYKEFNDIINPSDKEKKTSDYKDYQLAKDEGFTGNFMDFLAAKKGKADLTANRKDYDLAIKGGYKGTFMDFLQDRKASPKTDIESLKLQTQIMDIQDRMAEREVKKEEAKKIKDNNARQAVKDVDSLIEEIDRATGIATKNPWTTTGLGGYLLQNWPGTDAKKLRSVLQTVKSNIGWKELQKMRDSSPTGGALGQVSERELTFLQATIAALDPDMGDTELLKSLDKVRRHFANWRETMMGRNPDDQIVGTFDGFGKVTEGDINTTMNANHMTRDQVIEILTKGVK